MADREPTQPDRDAVETDGAHAEPGSAPSTFEWRRDVPLLAVLAIFAVGLVGFFNSGYKTIGPIDEMQHLDYAEKISRGVLVSIGERVGPRVLREEACRGIDDGFVLPKCDTRVLRPAAFPEAGYNTAAAHPPLYYLATGLGARFLVAVPGVDSFVSGARIMGGLWLAIGLGATWFLMAELGVSRWVRFALCLATATIPMVTYSSATVNNDAMALAIGAACVLATLRYLRGTAGPAWLLALGAIAMGVKATNLVVLGLCCLLMVMAAAAKRFPTRCSWRRAFVGIGSLAIGSGVVTVVWSVVSASRAVVESDLIPMSQRFHTDGLDLADFLRNILAAVPPTSGFYWPAELGGEWVGVWSGLVGLAIIGACFTAALGRGVAPRTSHIAIGLGATMLLVGPFFVLVNFVQGGSYFDIPSRYGLSLLPAALALLGVVFSDRVPRRIMVGLCTVGTIAMAGVVLQGV